MANLSNINNKFLVTTGGNVLIGQTGAIGSSLLQVNGIIGVGSSNQTTLNQTSTHFFMDMTSSTSYFRNTSTAGGGFIFRNSNIGDFEFDNEFAGNIKFNTSNVERMRIDSSGNLLLNQATSRIKGGGSTTGRLELSNSDSKSYMMITGSTRTSAQNLIYFVNDESTTLTLNADNSATFAGDIIVASGKISTLGGNNMTISGTAANHCGLSFATNAILPATQSATNTNTVDLGASSEKFKDFYYAGAMTGGSATFGGSINTSGLLVATAIDTDAYLADGSSANLHGRYLGQAIYGSGTGSGDNWGTLADVLRYKQCDVWRKNSSTNVWSNPSNGDTLVQGNYAAKWSGINMEPAYSEYVFYFSNGLGYSFLSQTIIQHSTNGNSFDFYIEIATSTTNPYDTTGWTTKVTKTGISSWPGLTCIQQSWEVGGGYPSLMRIRIVPTWNNSNLINLGSFQAYGSYGTFSHAWSTLFDRSVNFQSKIGVGTNPSRALDVTQTALIQGAGNVTAGTLALGPRASGVGKWSSISGAHYDQSSGSGNGSGAAGIMIIGTYASSGGNDIYVGGGPYEMNAATTIGFYTHGTNTSTAGGTERMRITSAGDVEITGGYTSSQVFKTSGALRIVSNSNVDTGNVALELLNDATGTRYLASFANNYGVVGSVSTLSTSTSFNTSSDYRLKEDLQDFAGLDMVCKIPVYNFKWKVDENRTYGVMAHELQKVLPQAVVGEKDAEQMQGVDYSKIVPLLVKSIQELKAEIELLKSK